MITQIWGVPIYKQSTNFTYSQFTEEEKSILSKLRESCAVASNIRKYFPNQAEIIKNDGQLLNDPGLKRLKDIITPHADNYIKDVICTDNDVFMANSWYTVNKKGDIHRPHFHRHTLFSVCYYPVAYSGNLVLSSTRGKNSFTQDYLLGMNYTRFNEFNCMHWEVPISSGDIVIFPGWVEHSTTENESDKERICVGANYWVHGEMQFTDELDRITI